MRYVTTVLALGLVLGSILPAVAIEPQDAERIADAIYRAEGGPAAKVPYGILSVHVRDEQDARKVCLNTIRNNWQRWSDAGRPGDFIDFLGNRYCPPSVDPVGNRNWRRNVKLILSRSQPVARTASPPQGQGLARQGNPMPAAAPSQLAVTQP